MNLKLKFSGQQAHEEVPTVALYLLDKSGRVHEKLAASKDGSLNLTQAREHKGAILALGPDMADIAHVPVESLMQFRLSDQLPIWEKAGGIEILPPYWRGWNPFRICVGGRIRRCRPFIFEEIPRFHLGWQGPVVHGPCYPICNGIVEVWARTCCCRPPIIYELPSIIARIEQEIALNPLQFLPPHNPGDPPPYAERVQAADALAKARAQGSARVVAAPNTQLAQDLKSLKTLPAEQALAYFHDNARLLPFWCHCSNGKIGETPLNPDGSFHFCYNRLPLLQLGFCSTVYYYVVRQWQDTQWVTVYDGGAAHQYFSAAEFADLETWSGRSCGQNPPPPGTDFATLQQIGATGAWALNSHYQGAIAGVDQTQTAPYNVATPPADGGLVTANGAPWATTLYFMLYFDPAMQNAPIGAFYYRMSVAPADLNGNAVGTPQPIAPSGGITWNYFEFTGGNWETLPYNLGPHTVGGASGLYEIPYNASKQWLNGQYHWTLDTTVLTGPGSPPQYGNGRYMVILELFDSAGNQIRPTGSTGAGADKPFEFLRLLTASGPGSTASVPFSALSHLFWFDNRPCYGKIEDFDVDGVPDTDVCQFLSGPAASQFQVGYRAFHVARIADPLMPPHTFMSSYSVTWHEGLNGPSGTLDSGGDTDRPTPPSFTGANQKTPAVPFSTLLGTSTVGTKCTFTVNLDIYPKHTNGFSTIQAFEVHTEGSFALEIT